LRAAIYGASSSGYYASEILKLQGYTIMFYIDQTGTITDARNFDNVIVYKNVAEIQDESIKSIDFLLIALGNKDESRLLQQKLSSVIHKPIKTIHDEPYELIYSQLKKQKYNYLEECGFYRSINERKSVDKNGEPIPWITYPCIEFLSSRINKNMKVFEYGSGNSTLWWSKRVDKIFAVEHDKEWYIQVKNLTKDTNVEIVHRELIYNGNYSKEILKHKNIDIVIIDGRDRVNCAINSLHSLSKSGVIIWDNTDRECYKAGYDHLIKSGFKQIEFIGMIPIYDFKSQTSIFYKNDNCLGL